MRPKISIGRCWPFSASVWVTRLRMADDDPRLADVLSQLAKVLFTESKFNEAEPLARECLAIREEKLPNDWSTFVARSLLGACLLGQKKYAEAEPLLLSGYEGMREREAKDRTAG